MKQAYYFIFVTFLFIAIASSGLTGATIVDLDDCPSDVDNELLGLYSDFREDYSSENGGLQTLSREYRVLFLYFNNNFDCFCENKNYWQTMILLEYGKDTFYDLFTSSLNNLYGACPENILERSTTDLTGSTQSDDSDSQDEVVEAPVFDTGPLIEIEIAQPDCTEDGECEIIFVKDCALEVSGEDLCASQCPIDCVSEGESYICPQ